MIKEKKAERKEVQPGTDPKQNSGEKDNLTERFLWNPDKYSGVGKRVSERVEPYRHRQADGFPGLYL